MTPELKQFIESHITLIEDGRFERLYDILVNDALSVFFKDRDLVSEFTQTLLHAGIDPANDLIEIPYFYLKDSNIESYSIPNNIIKIGQHAFGSCKILHTITIPSSVTEIEANAFYGCSSLEELYIPDSVTILDCTAVSNCAYLKTVHLPLKLDQNNRTIGLGWGLPSLEKFTYSGTVSQFKKSQWYKLKSWRSAFSHIPTICSDGTATFS